MEYFILSQIFLIFIFSFLFLFQIQTLNRRPFYFTQKFNHTQTLTMYFIIAMSLLQFKLGFVINLLFQKNK